MKIFRPYRLKPLWLAIGTLLVAAVIYLSLTASFPDYLRIEVDLKLNHVLAYAVLMFYFAQLTVNARANWFFAGLFVAMGIVLEYLQGMTGCRTFSYYDMFTNSLGVCTGYILSRTRLGNTVAYADRKMAVLF